MTRIIIITKTIEVLIRVIGPYFFCRGYVNEGDININYDNHNNNHKDDRSPLSRDRTIFLFSRGYEGDIKYMTKIIIITNARELLIHVIGQ